MEIRVFRQEDFEEVITLWAVSYTHLTLPTNMPV